MAGLRLLCALLFLDQRSEFSFRQLVAHLHQLLGGADLEHPELRHLTRLEEVVTGRTVGGGILAEYQFPRAVSDVLDGLGDFLALHRAEVHADDLLAVLADGCDGEVAEEPAVDVGVAVDLYRAEEDGDA